MSALAAGERQPAGGQAEAEWSQIEAVAPRVAAVMHRYLRQLGTFLAPRSVDAADSALRQLAQVAAHHRGDLGRCSGDLGPLSLGMRARRRPLMSR